MSPGFFAAILQELIGLGVDLYKRFHGDAAAAVREIARVRQHGAQFEAADKAARAELEGMKK